LNICRTFGFSRAVFRALSYNVGHCSLCGERLTYVHDVSEAVSLSVNS